MKFSPLPASLRQLQYLVAVAEAKSFRRAAERCHVSQPSLSSQIAELEAALGVKLFERTQRGALVTTAGEELVKRARRILGEIAEFESTAQRFVDPLAGQLRLGIIPTLAPYLLPKVVRALRQAYPTLAVRWTEDKTSVLVKQVADGELDAAVLALHSSLGGLRSEALAEDPFVLAVSKQHRLARSSTPITPAELVGEHFLLLDDGHCFRDQALEFCGQAGLEELGFRATSLPTLVQMVSAGTFVTLLPKIAIATESRRADIALRRLTRPEPSRTIVLSWRPGSPLSEAMLELARTMSNIIKH